MYKPDIFDGIIKNLVYHSNLKNGLTYTVLYRQLAESLGRKVSHRDYSSHLSLMVLDGLLGTEKGEEKKILKRYFLTEKARKMFQLKILGIGSEYEKRLSLYQLLIYYETFKRGQVLTDDQLKRVLKRYGIRRENLKKVDTTQFDGLDIQTAYEEPGKEIEIIQYPAALIWHKIFKACLLCLKPWSFC
jgi:hypothetical protein